MTKLPIIDADGHVLEPMGEILAEVPRALLKGFSDPTDRTDPRGAMLEYSLGSLCTPGSLAAGGRVDIDFATEVDRAVDDPERRLERMDEQGIAVSVLYPTMSLGLDLFMREPVLRHAYARAYNDWIRRFCSRDPLRLRWIAVVPFTDVKAGAEEVERVLALGTAGAMLSPIPTRDGRDLGSPEHDPIWARLAEAGVPGVVHAADPTTPELGMQAHWRNRARWQMGVPIQLQLAVLAVIDGRVLERFPALRVGFFEGDIGWLPHWLGRLDETYQKMALVSNPPRRSALEQFRQQCCISGEPADRGFAATVDLVGPECVLWASDWPHQDGAWPDPIRLLCDRDDLSEAQKRTIFVDAPARFYGLEVRPILAHLGKDWAADASLDQIPGLLAG